jgi:hypothetical protein
LSRGFGSGAYSAKLLTGNKQRFLGSSQARRCGEEVLRMFVTGGPAVRDGGGIPHVAHHGGRVVREYAGHRRKVADVSVHHAEQMIAAWFVVIL